MTKDNAEKKMEIQIPDYSSVFENPHSRIQNPTKSVDTVSYRNEINQIVIPWNSECDLAPYEKREVISSMEDWECYMYCKEHDARLRIIPDNNLPPVRNRDRSNITIQFSSRKNRCNLFTYPSIEIRLREDNWNDEINEVEEKNKLLKAQAEKVRGNEAYKSENYMKACEHYSNCIALVHIKEAYNNRAQANMKLRNFTSALPDLNEVLKTDPFNIKALYRRAICRKEIRMFNEAIRDVESILENQPKSKEARTLLNNIKKEMAKLNGKTYRIRENFGSRKTFQIDISQLPVYAQCENDYLLEVDKTGCVKSCVCGYCIDEDRRTRFRSTSLRIKERDRWKRLTHALLDEMRISSPVATVSKDLKEIRNNEYPANSEKWINGNANNVHNSHEMSNSFSQSGVMNCLKIKHKKSTCENEKIKNDVRFTSCAKILMEDESKSVKNNKNIRDQQSEQFEDLFKNMHLYSQQPSTLNTFKKKFDSRLDHETLTNMIKYVCQLFRSEIDWKLVSECLSVIASLERFNIIINMVDDQIKNDLELLLNKAINSNLENATELKALYFSH